jgi:MFS family permease
MPWPAAFCALGAFGLVAAVVIWKLAGTAHQEIPAAATFSGGMLNSTRLGRGFYLLLAIGIIDSATRMGFLTFIPFLLREKGADLPIIGLALSLVFAGGAVGKLVCGVLGQRLGILKTVLLTEAATALGILALLPLDLAPAMALLALIGVMLNGTSSVLYGSVPELVTSERRAGAFGLFYTGTIGSGAVAPVIYGLFSDALGVSFMMMIISGIVLFTLPLAVLLNSSFSRPPPSVAP